MKSSIKHMFAMAAALAAQQFNFLDDEGRKERAAVRRAKRLAKQYTGGRHISVKEHAAACRVSEKATDRRERRAVAKEIAHSPSHLIGSMRRGARATT